MWITLKPLKPSEMLKRCLKGTCTEVTNLIHQEGFCTKSLTFTAQPLQSSPLWGACAQLRLCNTVPGARPWLLHALQDDLNHQNTTPGGFKPKSYYEAKSNYMERKIQNRKGKLGTESSTLTRSHVPKIWGEATTYTGDSSIWDSRRTLYLDISVRFQWACRDANPDGHPGTR